MFNGLVCRVREHTQFNKFFTYLDSVGKTLVFSDDKVFSYKRVERRCIIPPPLLGPTVWFPFAGSNLDEVLVLAGLEDAKNVFP